MSLAPTQNWLILEIFCLQLLTCWRWKLVQQIWFLHSLTSSFSLAQGALGGLGSSQLYHYRLQRNFIGPLRNSLKIICIQYMFSLPRQTSAYSSFKRVGKGKSVLKNDPDDLILAEDENTAYLTLTLQFLPFLSNATLPANQFFSVLPFRDCLCCGTEFSLAPQGTVKMVYIKGGWQPFPNSLPH